MALGSSVTPGGWPENQKQCCCHDMAIARPSSPPRWARDSPTLDPPPLLR